MLNHKNLLVLSFLALGFTNNTHAREEGVGEDRSGDNPTNINLQNISELNVDALKVTLNELGEQFNSKGFSEILKKYLEIRDTFATASELTVEAKLLQQCAMNFNSQGFKAVPLDQTKAKGVGCTLEGNVVTQQGLSFSHEPFEKLEINGAEIKEGGVVIPGSDFSVELTLDPSSSVSELEVLLVKSQGDLSAFKVNLEYAQQTEREEKIQYSIDKVFFEGYTGGAIYCFNLEHKNFNTYPAYLALYSNDQELREAVLEAFKVSFNNDNLQTAEEIKKMLQGMRQSQLKELITKVNDLLNLKIYQKQLETFKLWEAALLYPDSLKLLLDFEGAINAELLYNNEIFIKDKKRMNDYAKLANAYNNGGVRAFARQLANFPDLVNFEAFPSVINGNILKEHPLVKKILAGSYATEGKAK